MKIPKPLSDLIDSFQKLPGIGPKSAQRLTYYLLHVPQTQLDDFAESLSGLKKNTVLCSICKNVSETDPCPICADKAREVNIIMVVEQPLDILAFEKTRNFFGLYHVLHGAISPLDNIGPEELYIDDLFDRLTNGSSAEEVIIATNPTMEGDATAMYLSKKLKEIEVSQKVRSSQLAKSKRDDKDGIALSSSKGNEPKIRITRLGMGVPTGADLEYADETTLTQAIKGRRVI